MHIPHMTAAVLKVASRCNLNCTYCYMYNLKDRSYSDQPPLMSERVADAVISKVARHCRTHSIKNFAFIFHGGEPLLAKDEFFVRFVAEARRAIGPNTRLHFLLQTNGALLNSRRSSTFVELGIKLGISIDGPPSVHDRHRVDHRGAASYGSVKAGWDAAASTGAPPGFLAVIDPDQDVHEAYRHLKSLRPRKADFLFPDSTHDSASPGVASGATPYGDWLLALFGIWIDDQSRDFEIRLFIDILKLLFAPSPGSGIPKRGYHGTIFIEPDGSIGTLDLLRGCEEGMGSTSLNIQTCELDDAFTDPMVRLYYHSNERVCAECGTCSLLQICGGGTLSHRYSAKNGFDNPSVYCADLKKLIGGIRAWAVATLSEA